MSEDERVGMPTKEQILEVAKDCPQIKQALQRLFPKAVEDEGWRSLSYSDCKLGYDSGRFFLYIARGSPSYGKAIIGYIRDLEYKDQSGYINTKVKYDKNGRLSEIWISPKK